MPLEVKQKLIYKKLVIKLDTLILKKKLKDLKILLIYNAEKIVI